MIQIQIKILIYQVRLILILNQSNLLTYLHIIGVSSDEEYVPVKKSVHDIPLLKRIAEMKEKNKLRNR